VARFSVCAVLIGLFLIPRRNDRNAHIQAFRRRVDRGEPDSVFGRHVIREVREGKVNARQSGDGAADAASLKAACVRASSSHPSDRHLKGDAVMKRRVFLKAGVALFAAPLGAHAQPARRIWRVGIIRASVPPSAEIDAFRESLRGFGYIEGENLIIETRWADGNELRLPSLMAELLRLKVDLVVASAPAATRVAKDATTTIPIVMVTVADPVAFGFIQSLARPGSNVTALVFMHPELSGKRLELLKAAVPSLTRLGVLWNGANPYKAADFKEVEAAATSARVILQSLPVKDSRDLDAAFGAARASRVDALVTLEDPFTVAHRNRIVELAGGYRLPALYGR
jgi:putative tryptophan/tyrosine transport system substrate-binding protein